jgi:RNase P/RNase MRP subunit POP5
MQKLNPALREKKRYVLIKGKNLKENFEKAIFDYVGILGMAKASPKVIKSENDSLVISVNREMLNHVKASFAIFPEKIEVLKVSGTLKGLGK